MDRNAPEKIWTYDDLPDTGDGRRFEILDGALYVSPSPSAWHQEILKRLFRIIDRELEGKGIAKVFFAPLDVILSPTRVVVPDLFVVRMERMSILEQRGAIEAPDLVVEVLSPSNIHHDRVRKRRFYARNKVREYWIVDPAAEAIEVLTLIEGGLSYQQAGWFAAGDRVASATFDLEFDVDPIFAKDDGPKPVLRATKPRQPRAKRPRRAPKRRA